MRTKLSSVGVLAVFSAIALSVAAPAKADITVYESGGSSVWINGRAAAHLQVIAGDKYPDVPNRTGWLISGFDQGKAATDEKDKILRFRLGSGWIGTQFGLGVAQTLSDAVKVKGYFAVSMDDIANNKDKTANKGVDMRQGFGVIESTWGSLLFGRELSIFGSGIGSVVYNYSYADAVGNPCNIDGTAITCGPNGAGGIYPGFNSQIAYSTPYLGDFGFKVGVYDPATLGSYNLRPFPRVEGELSFNHKMRSGINVMFVGQGLAQPVSRLYPLGTVSGAAAQMLPPPVKQTVTVLGGLAALRVEVGESCKYCSKFGIGVGAQGGPGMGSNVPMQGDQSVDPAGKLRMNMSYLVHAKYTYGPTDFGVGFGQAVIGETEFDKYQRLAVDANDPLLEGADRQKHTYSMLKSNQEIHGVIYQHFGPVVFSAEFMHWTSKWQLGEQQKLIYTGVGVNYTF